LNSALRLILPALVAAPAAMWSVGLAVIGPPGFTRFTFTPSGLLAVGWPAAAAIARLPVPRPVRFALVLIAGLAGGGLLAALVGGDFRAAWIGLAPGGITAAVWTLFNADRLADRPERPA
jgi:hypothetical protein